jgi:hypothetical protein
MYLDQENEKFEMKMDKALNKIKSIKKKKWWRKRIVKNKWGTRLNCAEEAAKELSVTGAKATSLKLLKVIAVQPRQHPEGSLIQNQRKIINWG